MDAIDDHIGYATMGEYPSRFKKRVGLPRYKSARDYMTRPQLNMAAGMEEIVKQLAEDCDNVDDFDERVKEVRDQMFNLCKLGRMHGKYIEPTKVAKTKAVTSAAPVQNAKTINNITNYFKVKTVETLTNSA